MGRAIEMENDIDTLKRELKQLKTAFSGLADTVETLQTTAPAKKNIDIHKETTTVKKKKTKKLVEEEAV